MPSIFRPYSPHGRINSEEYSRFSRRSAAAFALFLRVSIIGVFASIFALAMASQKSFDCLALFELVVAYSMLSPFFHLIPASRSPCEKHLIYSGSPLVRVALRSGCGLGGSDWHGKENGNCRDFLYDTRASQVESLPLLVWIYIYRIKRLLV